MNGYDKFFKEAQKNAGLTSSAGAKGGAKFKLKPQKKDVSTTPEDRVRRELASRLRKKQQLQADRRRKSVPVVSLSCAAVALVLCAFAYNQAEVVEEWISKVEIGVFGKASASEPEKAQPAKEAKSSTPTVTAKEKPAEAKAAQVPAPAPNIKQWTPEELSFFGKLNDRKKELDLRESELNKLEEELQKRKAELDEKLKSLEAMRADISKTLKGRVAADQVKVDKLVQVYSSMKAQQAAKLIETLNEDLAVEILDKMKKKSAAEILDMMNAKKARRLSELLTGYERSTASTGPSDDEATTKK